MNKNDRHELIKTIIHQEKISTQKEIQDRLEKQHVAVTQTTLSRDLRELGLTKIREAGKSYYALPGLQEETNLGTLMVPYVHKVERASFILVIHTRLGEAAIVSNIIDAEKPETILGTIAGADTLVVICRDEEAAIEVEKDLSPN